METLSTPPTERPAALAAPEGAASAASPGILETAPLQLRPGSSAEFEKAFAQAQALIAAMPGYRGHELQRCLERPDHYLLLVRWDSVAHHEQGFRQSPEYQQWRALLHHFYEPFPTVLHYEAVPACTAPQGGLSAQRASRHPCPATSPPPLDRDRTLPT